MTERHYDIARLKRVCNEIEHCSATIRAQDSDFQVDEVLPFEPDGEGGHAWLLIKQQGINTEWLARQLAAYAGVPPLDVGYAGLKDRHAITTQWFSVKLEGVVEPDWSALNIDGMTIMSVTRHSKKLRRGVLAGNRFTLTLTALSGEKPLWEQRLKKVALSGVPNYFAEQRFGHGGGNLQRVETWFSTGKGPKKRHQKSMYLSSARSWLFNWVLSNRVERGDWNQLLVGDQAMLAGTRGSIFTVEAVDDALTTRVAEMDIHPTGPLWGKGQQVTEDSLLFETEVLSPWRDWQQGLEKAGLTAARRALRLYPEQFEWQWHDEHLTLHFFLPAGCYATAILRELGEIQDMSVIRRTEQNG